MNNLLDGRRILITGGTGSLGTALVRRIVSGDFGEARSITIYSRDEAKQHSMAMEFKGSGGIRFIIGDVRNYPAVLAALQGVDVVFNTAAMKHVGACERNPWEAVLTNCNGTENIIRAIRESRSSVETVVGVSSDKGCHPVNVYGATKFIQEKLLLQANEVCHNTRFVSVCYGNVMASRGSVIPIFRAQVKAGWPVTVTHPMMTRFLISLDQAVDTLMAALSSALPGEVYVPVIPSAYVGDIARAIIGSRDIPITIVGKGQGEKMHEVLITEEEIERTVKRDTYYVITPNAQRKPVLSKEYNSRDYLISLPELKDLLTRHGLVS